MLITRPSDAQKTEDPLTVLSFEFWSANSSAGLEPGSKLERAIMEAEAPDTAHGRGGFVPLIANHRLRELEEVDAHLDSPRGSAHQGHCSGENNEGGSGYPPQFHQSLDEMHCSSDETECPQMSTSTERIAIKNAEEDEENRPTLACVDALGLSFGSGSHSKAPPSSWLKGETQFPFSARDRPMDEFPSTAMRDSETDHNEKTEGIPGSGVRLPGSHQAGDGDRSRALGQRERSEGLEFWRVGQDRPQRLLNLQQVLSVGSQYYTQGSSMTELALHNHLYSPSPAMIAPPTPTIWLQSSERSLPATALRFSGLQHMGSGSNWFGAGSAALRVASDSATSSNYNENGRDTEASSSRALFDPEYLAARNPFEKNVAVQFEAPGVGSSMLQRVEETNYSSPGGVLTPAIWDTCAANLFSSLGHGQGQAPTSSYSPREMPLWSETPNGEAGLAEPWSGGPGALGLDLDCENQPQNMHLDPLSLDSGPQQQDSEYHHHHHHHHRAGMNWNWVPGADDINHLGDEDVHRCTPYLNVLPEAPAMPANPEGFVDPTLGLAHGLGGPPIMDWPEHRIRLENTLLIWRKAQFRAQIIGHPVFGAILRSHINCIHLMTPAHKLDEVNLQINNVTEIYQSYLAFAPSNGSFSSLDSPHQLDQLLNKVLMEVQRYEAALQRNLKLQATPTYAHLYRVGVLLRQLTGKNLSPPDDLDLGPTMSDDDDDDILVEEVADEEQQELLDGDVRRVDDPDDRDKGGFGPSLADRAAMWTVRGHLIRSFGLDTYRMKIREVRDEIMRKRRAGKLPVGTTDVLKTWWDHHTAWPYPSEEEKQELIESTGLELKQVNNWFINQRKRNWNNNPTMGAQGDPRHRLRDNF